MKSGPTRVIIVDDSEIYRTGLRDPINRHDGLVVAAEVECDDTAIEAIMAAAGGREYVCRKSDMALVFGGINRPPPSKPFRKRSHHSRW